MKVQEYQAREFLSAYAVPFSKGTVVRTPEEAASAFGRLANPACIAKVQVQMGGRGKAGGVRRVKTAAEAEAMSREFLGKPFSTTQSAGQSKIVRSLLVTEDIPIQEEYYLAITIDRQAGRPVILVSREGGVEIEEVAHRNPAAILKFHFLPGGPPPEETLRAGLAKVFPEPGLAGQIAAFALKLARFFLEKDATIVEINPLARVPEGSVLALDAKIVFDENALFRHEDIRAAKDPDEEDAREHRAKEFGLSYVSMDGNVGCLVNGAGLAMATMDMIKLAGGEPANFLDVGGGATADQVREGFKIILQDERVAAILVNIFGGIMKCDVIAEGVIQASRELGLELPLVVRLEGTHVEEGRALLAGSGLRIHACRTIQEAAEAAVREAAAYRRTHADTRR